MKKLFTHDSNEQQKQFYTKQFIAIWFQQFIFNTNTKSLHFCFDTKIYSIGTKNTRNFSRINGEIKRECTMLIKEKTLRPNRNELDCILWNYIRSSIVHSNRKPIIRETQSTRNNLSTTNSTIERKITHFNSSLSYRRLLYGVESSSIL